MSTQRQPAPATTPVEVGIREFKAKLSEYLDRAAAGECITVTKRGEPVATVQAIRGETRLEKGIREGWITPARRPPWPSGFVPPRYKARPGAPTLQQILDEDREDRF